MLPEYSSLLSRALSAPSWRLMLRLAVLYFLAIALLSSKVALGDGWHIFWPLNGITNSLQIGRPRRDWLIMLAGKENWTGIGDYYMYDIALGSEVTERLLSMCEVTLSAWLLPQFTTLDDWLRKPGLYLRFAAAVTIGPMASGLFAAVHYHLTSGLDYVTAFNNWAIADALGIGFVAAPLRSHFAPRKPARCSSLPGSPFPSPRSERRWPSWRRSSESVSTR